MKKIKAFVYSLVAVGLIAFASSCASSKNNYVSNNFQQLKGNHKTIAIIPFDVRFPNQQNNGIRNQQNNNGYNAPQGNSQQAVQAMPHTIWSQAEQQGSLAMQKDLFTALSKEVQKGKYTISFQDFTKTNKILEENNIMLNDIMAQDKGKLAQLLGVDAVIWGETNVRVTNINRYTYRNPYAYNRTYNDGVETTANIYDASTGEMVWSTKQAEHPNPSFPSRPSDLANRLMEVIAKDLPYKIARK